MIRHWFTTRFIMNSISSVVFTTYRKSTSTCLVRSHNLQLSLSVSLSFLVLEAHDRRSGNCYVSCYHVCVAIIINWALLCAEMTEHAQIVSCCWVINDDYTCQFMNVSCSLLPNISAIRFPCRIEHVPFLQRGRIARNAERCISHGNSVRLSVRPSVTRWYPIPDEWR